MRPVDARPRWKPRRPVSTVAAVVVLAALVALTWWVLGSALGIWQVVFLTGQVKQLRRARP